VADGSGFGDAASFVSATISAAGEGASAFAARGFFRSGFACFATLSHKARSSSLKLRWRRGDADHSGIEIEGGRFIGRGGNI
jgi:hypothetical protein